MKFRCVFVTTLEPGKPYTRAVVYSRNKRQDPRMVWSANYATPSVARYAADSMLRLYTRAHFGRR